MNNGNRAKRRLRTRSSEGRRYDEVPVGAGGEAFGFFEGANKIVQVVKTALEAYLTEGILFVGEELASQADAFAGDVFQRGESELFSKPFKKYIAAEIGFLA